METVGYFVQFEERGWPLTRNGKSPATQSEVEAFKMQWCEGVFTLPSLNSYKRPSNSLGTAEGDYTL